MKFWLRNLNGNILRYVKLLIQQIILEIKGSFLLCVYCLLRTIYALRKYHEYIHSALTQSKEILNFLKDFF